MFMLLSPVECPWPARPPKNFNAPRVLSSPANRFHAHYPSTLNYSLRSSNIVRCETTKGRITLKRNRLVQRTIVSKRRKCVFTRFWVSFKGLFRDSNEKRTKKIEALTFPFVPHEQRDAYGHYSRPITHTAEVPGSMAERRPSITINSDDQWRSLHIPNNRPSNWSGCADNPALPPTLFEGSRVPIPPTHDIQLHPYLQHRCNGPHPITFDIALGANKITHNTRESTTLTFKSAHLAQPATYPSVTYMRIESVVDDPLPHFPWTIEVVNAQGITCGDVFHAISRSFSEYVTEKEYNCWTRRRQKMAARAYYSRISAPLGSVRPVGVVAPGDGLRRIDYIGERVMFRGLERASVMRDGTWIMYFGSSRSAASCFGGDSTNKL